MKTRDQIVRGFKVDDLLASKGEYFLVQERLMDLMWEIYK